MKRYFEIFVGVVILIFMGIVFCQLVKIQLSSEQVVSLPTPPVDVVVPDSELRLGDETPPDFTDPQIPELQPVACTMDAKQCPDGSFVGRVGPDCEFAKCSVLDSKFPIRYGEDVSGMEEYRSDCEQRMGIFDECGSACGPEAEACVDVCSMICTGPASEHVPPDYQAEIECSPESKLAEMCTMDYTPVCGKVEVQCVTTPCNPVLQTFGNACGACASGNVISYTEGACPEVN